MTKHDANDATDELVGTVLAGRYRLDELLGEGGMGKVYAAEHLLLRKRLAVKVLLRELCEMPDVVARFQREAMATANINHSNIAAATDCGKLPDGSLFLVLELVLGKSLRDEVAAGALPLTRALHIVRQIASALAAAHALGIVHRDLKPENVMLVKHGTDPDFVKVLDFGIAKVPSSTGAVASAPLTKAGVVFGTPAYMPPEQALGQSVDHRADLYALGVIAYELLTGVRPFTAKSDAGIVGQQLAKPVPTFAERAPDVSIPQKVEQVVQKLLTKDVAARCQTADEVVRAIDELAFTPDVNARQVTAPIGAPTAFLGTTEQIYGAPLPAAGATAPEAAAPVITEPLPVRPPEIGPSGTLPLLDEQRSRDLAAHVAEARRPSSLLAKNYARALAIASLAVAVVCDSIDENRHRLPPRVRSRLQKVPAAVLLVAVVLPVWSATFVPFVLITTRSERGKAIAAADATPLTEAPAPDPVIAELAEAKKQGHAALQKLALAHPKHARVQLELALSHASHTDHAAATTALGRALRADSKLAAEPRASELLSAAVRKRDSEKAAFELLEGPMGAAGATVLYDLSVDQKVPASSRTRAQKWVVESSDFLKVAPPNILVAARLRYGKSCSDRHSLLPKAGEVGDRRALAYLKIMKFPKGCGRRARDDCFPCMRKDKALAQAIEAIEKRTGNER